MAPILFDETSEPVTYCNGNGTKIDKNMGIQDLELKSNGISTMGGLTKLHASIDKLSESLDRLSKLKIEEPKTPQVPGLIPMPGIAPRKKRGKKRASGASANTSTESSAKTTPPTSASSTSDADDEDAGETIKPGTECTHKDLYQGKADDQGRFEWLDHIPTDLNAAVEDEKTAKHALLVRHMRVYNDPAKVLTIHSVVVQSPHLKKLLKKVLKGYPGIALNLKRLELSGQFEAIVHRWDKLTSAIEEIDDSTEDGKQVKEHSELFIEVMSPQLLETITTSRDMISKGLITYPMLWTLFYPGSTVFYQRGSHETALKLRSAKNGVDDHGRACFYVKAQYVDWNGSQFGTTSINIKVSKFMGTRKITSLATYPLDHHPDKAALLDRLLKRGEKWEALAGNHFKAYNGIGWRATVPEKVRVKGRIVIDGQGWQDFEPNAQVVLSSLPAPTPPTKEAKIKEGDDENDDEFVDDLAGEDDCDICLSFPFRIGRRIRAENDTEEGEAEEKQLLTAEQKIITTPTIRGYSLANKAWLRMDVDSVSDINFNSQAFEKLVLPAQQKELILGFTESQTAYKDCFDDVMEGKGRGIILLLCGPPGVGKSLTAESVAEEMKAPLYSVTAGDLGIGSIDVESKLKAIMEMCQRWNAILLIDEADVFLEERSLHELERNKLVTIFLRMIEWYEGIMFLTTNRVNTFDKAFQSRIHISLEYPDLTAESRKMVWKNFLGGGGLKHEIKEAELKSLSLMQMNGRQIKNVLKTAQLLARRKDGVLQYQHVLTVLDVTQHLHNNNRETERSRASIFC